MQRLLLLVLAALGLLRAAERGRTGRRSFPSVLPHNLTNCLLEGRPVSLCAWFHAYNTSGCIDSQLPSSGVDDARAFRCLNESRCIGLYDVPTCITSFNYTTDLFNHTECQQLVGDPSFTALNASLGGNITFANGTGCDYLLMLDGWDTDYQDDDHNYTAPPPPPRLPRFHPCRGALEGDHVQQIRDVIWRAAPYTSHVVVALDPHIGPVAGGVSVGVCGLGFTQANEAVGHIYCRFTDGRYKVDVAAVHVDEHQLRCVAPDFTRFAVGMPHNVSVEISTSRGAHWTRNNVQFTYYATRPSIDAFGRPTWGYDPTFTLPAWQVAFEENEYGGFVPELYPPAGHPLNEGRPSPWDAAQDPFHARGASAAEMPVELDTGDRFEAAEDLVVRTRQSRLHGVEGSWGDRTSFLRAHHLVRDVYRQDVAAARAAFRELEARTTNGVI